MSDTQPEKLRPDTTGWPICPSDDNANRAWQKIAELARANCLVVQAYSGVMVLATPEAQRNEENGPAIRDDVLVVHHMRESLHIHGQEKP